MVFYHGFFTFRKMKKQIKFDAEILQHKDINAAFVEFPFSTEELYGKKGQVKVKALLDGKVDYRGSLANMGQGLHCLGLTQAIRKQLGKSFGNTVSVVIEEDTDERTVEVPEDVQILFDENQKARQLYDAMSYTHRKEYMRWITDAKKPESRENRKIKMIEMILAGKKGI